MKNCLTPQIYENVRPHSSNSVENSQSSRENTTPFSSTSPLASYKEVPPPPTHPGHYPDLGSDMLSAWISVLVAQTSLIPQENSGGIAKCQLISGYSSPCQHLASFLFFTVNSSSRCNLLLYNISFVFPKLCVKNAMWISFPVVYFPQYWFTTDTALNPPDWTHRQHRWSHKRVQRNKRPSGMRSFLPMIHYVLVVKLHVT